MHSTVVDCRRPAVDDRGTGASQRLTEFAADLAVAAALMTEAGAG